MSDELKPHPWSPQDTICIPEHAALHGGNPNIPAEVLSRSSIFFGGTGSGKTVSGVAPLLKKIVDSKIGKYQCAVLVIDPKHELLDVVRKIAGKRLIVVGGGNGPRIDFFEDTRGKIGVGVKDLLDRAIKYLSPQAAAIVGARGDNSFWHAAGYQLVAALTQLVGAIEMSGMSLLDVTKNSEYWPRVQTGNSLGADVERFLKIANNVGSHWDPIPGENEKAFAARIRVYVSVIQQNASGYLKGERIPRRNAQHTDVMHALRLMGRFARRQFNSEECIGYLECWARRISDKADEVASVLWRNHHPAPMSPVQLRLIAALDRDSDASNRRSWFSSVHTLLSQFLTALDGTKTDASSSDFRQLGATLIAIAEGIDRFDIASSLAWTQSSDTRTAYWHCDIAQQMVAPLVDQSLSHRLWLNPISPCPDNFNVLDAMDAGKVIVYQPSGTETSADNAFGRAIKSLWFKGTFVRQIKERGVAYVCDEFQRYATADEQSGEAHYIDRCRAYRGIVVLATQSIASMRLQLHRTDKSITHPEASAALDVLLANMGSKVFFRSTDLETISYLRQAFPDNNGRSVTSVRSIVSFPPGCCYFMSAGGHMGITQIKLAEQSSTRMAA